MNRLCILDLDGTLLDTLQDLCTSCNHALDSLGYPTHPSEQYKFLCGRGVRNLLKGSLPQELREDASVLSRMGELFFSHYREHMTDFTRPYEGMPGVLERLQEKGVYLAVASNKFHSGTVHLMEYFYPQIRFSAVLGQREGFPIKPDPRIVKEAMGKCPSIGVQDVLYVGDSDVDMQTGLSAGVRTAGALWGFRSREELQRYRPWRLLQSPLELEEAAVGQWD